MGQGAVKASSWIRYVNAALRSSKHISLDACKLRQTSGLNSDPKIIQRFSSDSWIHLVLAGLPCGIPGIGLDIEGAMQQAPQSIRHSIRTS